MAAASTAAALEAAVAIMILVYCSWSYRQPNTMMTGLQESAAAAVAAERSPNRP